MECVSRAYTFNNHLTNWIIAMGLWLLALKGALDKFNIIPQLFPKKSWDFYTIRSVGMSNDCMPSITF